MIASALEAERVILEALKADEQLSQLVSDFLYLPYVPHHSYMDFPSFIMTLPAVGTCVVGGKIERNGEMEIETAEIVVMCAETSLGNRPAALRGSGIGDLSAGEEIGAYELIEKCRQVVSRIHVVENCRFTPDEWRIALVTDDFTCCTLTVIAEIVKPASTTTADEAIAHFGAGYK